MMNKRNIKHRYIILRYTLSNRAGNKYYHKFMFQVLSVKILIQRILVSNTSKRLKKFMFQKKKILLKFPCKTKVETY